MRAPVIGFRVWKVARPIRRRVSDPMRTTFVHIADPVVDRARQLVGDPELAAWLSEKAKVPKRGWRWETEQSELEPGTLLPTATTRFGEYATWMQPGPVRFMCAAGHARPVADHTCGLHAWLTVRQAEDFARSGPDEVIGAVAAWGHLVMHGIEGFRAEWARIVALSWPRIYNGKPVSPQWARLAADRLGVPCVPLHRLEAVASEHGSRIRWRYVFDE